MPEAKFTVHGDFLHSALVVEIARQPVESITTSTVMKFADICDENDLGNLVFLVPLDRIGKSRRAQRASLQRVGEFRVALKIIGMTKVPAAEAAEYARNTTTSAMYRMEL